MANPGGVAPVEPLDEAVARAQAAIKELRRIPPGETAAAARRRSCAAIEAQRKLVEASRKVVTDAVAAKRSKTNGSNDTAKPATKVASDTGALITLMAQEFAKRDKRDAERDKQIAELKQENAEVRKNMLTYGDVWKPEKVYQRNQMTTYGGVLWLAKEFEYE